ncbi:MAG: hypothetical protein V1716_02835 [Candidatus Uhrbacteria bacterium]
MPNQLLPYYHNTVEIGHVKRCEKCGRRLYNQKLLTKIGRKVEFIMIFFFGISAIIFLFLLSLFPKNDYSFVLPIFFLFPGVYILSEGLLAISSIIPGEQIFVCKECNIEVKENFPGLDWLGWFTAIALGIFVLTIVASFVITLIIIKNR